MIRAWRKLQQKDLPLRHKWMNLGEEVEEEEWRRRLQRRDDVAVTRAKSSRQSRNRRYKGMMMKWCWWRWRRMSWKELLSKPRKTWKFREERKNLVEKMSHPRFFAVPEEMVSMGLIHWLRVRRCRWSMVGMFWQMSSLIREQRVSGWVFWSYFASCRLTIED